MPRHYVTFGQVHTHRVDNQTLDCDSVAVYEAKNYAEGRTKAFKYFGDKFMTDYHAEQWDEKKLYYFPRGYVELNI